MKKVLFLAIAALAYVGIANAQPTTGTLTTASDTKLYTAGILDAAFSPATVATVRATTGGEYNFVIAGTNWNTVLGLSGTGTDTYTTFMLGSTLKLTSSSSTLLAETAPGNALSNTVTYTTPAADDILTLTETGYKTAGVTLCAATVEVTNVDVQAKQDAAVSLNATTFCASALVTTFPTISVDFTNNFNTQFALSITGPTGFTAMSASSFKNNGDITSWTLGSLSWPVTSPAGKYTITVSNVLDEVGVEATNASSLYGTVTYPNGQEFVIIPSPKPTLTTTAIK